MSLLKRPFKQELVRGESTRTLCTRVATVSKPPVDGAVDFIEPQYLERATISLTISTEITYKQGDFYGAISKAQEAIGFDLYDSVLIRLDRIRHQYKMMHHVDRDDAVLKGLDDLIGSLREPFPSGDA